jgi:hypothetical protein
MISDLIGQSPLFYRSVALERDVSDPSAGRSFVLTPWLARGAGEMLAGLAPGCARRAWRIIGDFGVGKSALALALVQALDPRLADPTMPLSRMAEEQGAPRLFPVLVTGSREGLAAALQTAVRQCAATPGLLSAKVRDGIKALDDPFEAVIALRDAVRGTHQFDGALLIVDEMGKFLETAGESEAFDIFGLQALAEAAARSGDAPLGVVLILHQGFQSYAEDWRSARRSEWEKVAERFEQLVFDHPLSHTAALLSAALAVDQGGVPPLVRKAHDDLLASVRSLGWLGPKKGEGHSGCWPLHPALVPVAARFFSDFGQNERSLFGFAASEEPFGLRAFAAETEVTGGFYALHHFFDYVASSFGHRLRSRSSAGEWDRIAEVFERTTDADPIETAVLKSVGLLNLLDAGDLVATRESLSEVLAPAFKRQDVEHAIERLEKGGLLYRRPNRPDLRLWSSRRVDLSTIWTEANREVEAEAVLRVLPKHLSEMPFRQHLLARRHSVETGTSRRFSVHITPADSVAKYKGHGEADGGIVAILCSSGEEARIGRAWAAEISNEDPRVLAVVAPVPAGAGAAMTNLLRYRWIIANAAQLQDDSYASAEIERSIADIETCLVAELETSLGLRGQPPAAGVELFWKGAALEGAAPLHVIISKLCNDIYHSAPCVENELVNRHTLTSAGASARQRLIEHMFASAHDPELGFTPSKSPPERALFLSLMRRGGIHREEDGEWAISEPPQSLDKLRLRPALTALRDRLSEDGGRVSLTDLYDRLARPPYGVRRGLAPLLLAVLLVAEGHRVALFERGTYCTKIDGAAFMRMLKAPEHFALQWVALEGVRADVFHRLSVLLDRHPQEGGIRLVVDPLIRFGAALPFYVQHSSALSPMAREVRRVLAQARSPIDLLFNELPAACGCEGFGLVDHSQAQNVDLYIDRLDNAIAELRGCYPKLLERMREDLLALLDAKDRGAAAERASSLLFKVREQQLRTFVLRLADAQLADDSWTEALGGALVGKPPVRWLDQDVDLWHQRLADLTGQFERVEAAAFGHGNSRPDAVRLAITRSDGHERATIVAVDTLDEGQTTIIQAIARMAAEAEITLEKLSAMLLVEAMAVEAQVAARGATESENRQESA